MLKNKFNQNLNIRSERNNTYSSNVSRMSGIKNSDIVKKNRTLSRKQLTENIREIYKLEKEIIKKIRDSKFVLNAKEWFLEENNNNFFCDGCNELYKEQITKNYIELHHKKHVSIRKDSELDNTYSSIEELKKDFLFLCPNCHKNKHLLETK